MSKISKFSQSVIFLASVVYGQLAEAVPMEYWLSVDDYAQLKINGSLAASYDAYPWGYAYGSVDLEPGWYSIDLLYRNRWGSTHLGFFQRSDASDPWEVVPLADLRSIDGNGNTIQETLSETIDFVQISIPFSIKFLSIKAIKNQ